MKRRSAKAVGITEARIAVDTKVLVRYLTWDDEDQAQEAARAIESGGVVTVATIVLCELVWVLRRAYRYADEDILNTIRRLVRIRRVELDRPAVEAGLAMLAKGADFADGIIQFEARQAKCARLFTFDRKFARADASETVVLLGGG